MFGGRLVRHTMRRMKRCATTQPDSIITDSTQPRIRTLGVIPARLASTRLPGKVLRLIAGRPMLAWVYEAARACPQLEHIVVATDAEEIAALCRANGWPAEL